MRQVDHDEVHIQAAYQVDRRDKDRREEHSRHEARGHREDRRQRPCGDDSDVRHVRHGHGHAGEVSVRQQGLVGVRGRRAGRQGGSADLRPRPLQEEADIPPVLRREAARFDSQGVRAEPQGHAGGRTHLPSGHEVQAGGHGVSPEHGPQRYDGHGRRARHLPDGEVLRCLHHHEEREHSLHGRPQGDHHRGSDQGGLRGRILRRNGSGGGDIRPPQEKREGKPIACAIPYFCWRYPWC